jgi:uncharacterized protein YcfL
MTRLALLSLVVITCTIAAGCETPDRAPAYGYGDPYPAPMNDPDITVLSPDLRQWLGFQEAIVVKADGRPIEVQVPVRNLASRQYLIEYRFLFYDDAGMELEPVMGWKFVSLDANQLVNLKANSMGPDAVRYRLEVRWSK